MARKLLSALGSTSQDLSRRNGPVSPFLEIGFFCPCSFDSRIPAGILSDEVGSNGNPAELVSKCTPIAGRIEHRLSREARIGGCELLVIRNSHVRVFEEMNMARRWMICAAAVAAAFLFVNTSDAGHRRNRCCGGGYSNCGGCGGGYGHMHRGGRHGCGGYAACGGCAQTTCCQAASHNHRSRVVHRDACGWSDDRSRSRCPWHSRPWRIRSRSPSCSRKRRRRSMWARPGSKLFERSRRKPHNHRSRVVHRDACGRSRRRSHRNSSTRRRSNGFVDVRHRSCSRTGTPPRQPRHKSSIVEPCSSPRTP